MSNRSFRRGFVIFLLGSLLSFLPSAVNAAGKQKDKEWIFELKPESSSEVYKRPAGAEFFWWDTAPEVQVELLFEDGTRLTIGSEEEFSKRIVEVKFINPTAKTQKVMMWAMF